MALTATVAKTSVTQKYPGLHIATITLTVADTEGPGFSKSFSQNYKPGYSIPGLEAKYLDEINAAISEYEAEQVIFKHAQFTSVIDGINSTLEA